MWFKCWKNKKKTINFSSPLYFDQQFCHSSTVHDIAGRKINIRTTAYLPEVCVWVQQVAIRQAPNPGSPGMQMSSRRWRQKRFRLTNDRNRSYHSLSQPAEDRLKAFGTAVARYGSPWRNWPQVFVRPCVGSVIFSFFERCWCLQ